MNMALRAALLDDDLDTARGMFKAAADANQDFHSFDEPDGEPLLHEIVAQGRLPAIQLLLEYGADVSIKTESERHRCIMPLFFRVNIMNFTNCYWRTSPIVTIELDLGSRHCMWQLP